MTAPTNTPLIDDEVRRFFPGQTDEQIARFYETAIDATRDDRPALLSTDLYLANIARNCGWAALKEYLTVTTGNSDLDGDDILAITEACAYWRNLENAELYAALFGAASEATNKKTVNARNQSLKRLTGSLDAHRIVEEV